MMPLLTGFVLGVASSAHCAVMCGPLVLAIGPRRSAGSAWTAFGRWLPYHAGRISVYIALAFPAGGVAEAAGRSGLGRALGVVIAAVLLAAAFGVTRRPEWRDVSWFVGQRAARLAAVAASWRQRFPRTATVVAGMANGLVPCGLVYAAALAAAGWGSFAGACATMLGFGLGTLPALAVVSLSSAALPQRLRPAVQKVAPVVLALAAALLLLRSFAPAPHHHMAAAPESRSPAHQAADPGHDARALHLRCTPSTASPANG
jgi:sulfite exporter TauE/SafE